MSKQQQQVHPTPHAEAKLRYSSLLELKLKQNTKVWHRNAVAQARRSLPDSRKPG
jgi:hypothetical protein